MLIFPRAFCSGLLVQPGAAAPLAEPTGAAPVLHLDPIPNFPRSRGALSGQAGGQSPAAAPGRPPAWQEQEGRGGVGRAVNHLCFLLSS